MRLLICTQAVDEHDPILGFFVRWVEELSKRAEHVEVICLRAGKYSLPGNVRVHALGTGGKLARAVRFKLLAWRLWHEYDTVFVHMNPEYLIIAGPLWKLLGKKVSLWYNHPADNLRLRTAMLFARQVFYTSPYAATARSRKATQMPVGIDTELFAPQPVVRNRYAIYLQGRVMPSKRIEIALAALRILREEIPEATLTIVGPEDAAYASELKKRFADLVESGAVRFLGPHKNTETPALYSAHGIAINLAASGHFDKTVFEAMACETPVVVLSQAFARLVPVEWVVPGESTSALAAALVRLFRLSDADYGALGAQERAAVVREHGLSALINELSDTMTGKQELRTEWYYLTTKSYPSFKADSGYVKSLAMALAKDERIKVSLYVSENKDTDLAPVALARMGIGATERHRAFRSIPTLWRLCRSLARSHSRAVIFTNEAYVLLLCGLYKKIFGGKYRVVADWHMAFSPGLTRKMLLLADFSIATSQRLKSALTALAPRGLDSVRVVYGGVDLAPFTAAKEEGDLRAKLRLPTNAFLVGYIGGFRTLGLEKGITTMLNALAFSTDDTQMVFAGGSDDEISFYRGIAQELGVESRAHFFGRMNPNELARYECAMDALVIPYPDEPHFREYGFPMKAYEYLAAGKPIVYSDLAIMREILEERGIAFAPGSAQALKEALDTARLPESQARALRNSQEASQFSWEAKARTIADAALSL